MNSRLIGRGFVNHLTMRGGNLFAEISVQQGSRYVTYRTVVDKDFSSSLVGLGGVERVATAFQKKPVMLCIVNPTVDLVDGRICHGGVLLSFISYDLYKSGMHDKSVFGS